MTFRSLIPHRPARAMRPAWGLRSGFGDLFDDFWGEFPEASVQRFMPRVDIEEADDAVVLTAELPGVEEKDFQVSLEQDVLTIKGEKRSDRDEKREGYSYVERVSGSFERSFRIPWEVDSGAVTARFKNGVLTVRVPKPEEQTSEPQTIPVSAS
jgi:HSP20 family protein